MAITNAENLLDFWFSEIMPRIFTEDPWLDENCARNTMTPGMLPQRGCWLTGATPCAAGWRNHRAGSVLAQYCPG